MGELRASASEVNLRARSGNWFCGFGARTEPATGEHDPICARGVLLDDGASRVAIVACDLIGFGSAQAWEIRARIASRSSIPAGNIVICCTHTHSGPASAPTRGLMGQVDGVWLDQAFTSIVDMVVGLEKDLVPARIAYASTQVEGIGYNRDDQTRPIDTELLTIAIDSVAGEPIATLLNYSTHAVVMGPSSLLFSGDYPGATARAVSSARGGVGMFLQGACGDVDPVVYQQRGWGTGTFEDCDRIGKTLADHALSSISASRWEREVTLGNATDMVELPMDPPISKEELAGLVASWENDRYLGGSDFCLRWAGEMLDAFAREMVPASSRAEITAISINDFTLIAVPFEAYSDIAVRVKSSLGPGRTAFVGYANGDHGYLASKWAKERGGYGPDTSCRVFPGLLTAFGIGSDDILAAKSVALGRLLASRGELATH